MVFIGKYSQNQARLMKVLKEFGGNPADSKSIVELHYNGRERPKTAQNAVVSVLNSLIPKVRRNKERFRIRKTYRRGPHPIQYWIQDSK